MTPRKSAENKWYVDVLFVLFILTICTIATIPQLEAGDYRNHISWTAELAERHYSHLPHPLYQQITLIIKTLIPFNVLNKLTNYAFALRPHWYYKLPGLLTAILSYLATALLIQKRFINYISGDCKKRQVLSWTATSICMIVAPILLFTLDQRLIIGYINPNLWHNPTYTLVKPFALWIFFFVIDYWDKPITFRRWISLAVMTGLSILAKPNFILAFLPALFVTLVIQTHSLKKLSWGMLSAMTIPAVILLLYQYSMSSAASGNQFFLIPFKAALYSAGSWINMIVFYLLSILFPFLVGIFSFNKVMDKFEFQLVWMNFVVAFLTWILFVELPYMSSLNFGWGLNLALFLLFTYSIGWLLRNPWWVKKRDWKTALTGVALGMHFLSGVVYTLITIIHPGPVR